MNDLVIFSFINVIFFFIRMYHIKPSLFSCRGQNRCYRYYQCLIRLWHLIEDQTWLFELLHSQVTFLKFDFFVLKVLHGSFDNTNWFWKLLTNVKLFHWHCFGASQIRKKIILERVKNQHLTVIDRAILKRKVSSFYSMKLKPLRIVACIIYDNALFVFWILHSMSV